MSRRSRNSGIGEFGTSLADILTTALGCVLLLFMVAVLNVKQSLQAEQEAHTQTIARLLAEETERQKAELERQKAERQRLAAESEAQTQAQKKGEAENALKSAEEQRHALQQELLSLRASLEAQNQRYAVLKEAAQGAMQALDPHTAAPVDVMLVIDATRSMQASLDSARENLSVTLDALREVSPSARIGVVVFRDKREIPSMRLIEQPLTHNAQKLAKFLSGIEATNTSRGRDLPEWLCGGLEAAIAAKWSKNAIKIIIVVSDAESHPEDMPTCLTSARAFSAAGGEIHVVSTLPQDYETNEYITQNYNEVVLARHAEIASAGGGLHVAKADSNALLAAILKAAFRNRTAEPMERLQEALKTAETISVRPVLPADNEEEISE